MRCWTIHIVKLQTRKNSCNNVWLILWRKMMHTCTRKHIAVMLYEWILLKLNVDVNVGRHERVRGVLRTAVTSSWQHSPCFIYDPTHWWVTEYYCNYNALEVLYVIALYKSTFTYLLTYNNSNNNSQQQLLLLPIIILLLVVILVVVEVAVVVVVVVVAVALVVVVIAYYISSSTLFLIATTKSFASKRVLF